MFYDLFMWQWEVRWEPQGFLIVLQNYVVLLKVTINSAWLNRENHDLVWISDLNLIAQIFTIYSVLRFLLSFACSVNWKNINIKRSRQWWNAFPNNLKFVKNSPLLGVCKCCETLSQVFDVLLPDSYLN